MNIATEKKALIKQFNELEDAALIHAIKNLINPKEPGKNSQSDSKHSLSYAREIIEINKRAYVLNFPLRCLLEKEDDHYVVKNESLDIYTVGKTIEAVEKNFDEEFDYLYQRLNSLEDKNLSDRFIEIKKFINYFVKEVKAW